MAAIAHTAEEQLDIARAIGIIAELRACAPVLTGSPEQRKAGRSRLDRLLAEYEKITARLADVIVRHADPIRERLDALEPRRTPTGEPDNTGANGLTNAAVELGALIDEKVNGDVAKYARLVARRVASSTAKVRAELKEGAE